MMVNVNDRIGWIENGEQLHSTVKELYVVINIKDEPVPLILTANVFDKNGQLIRGPSQLQLNKFFYKNSNFYSDRP